MENVIQTFVNEEFGTVRTLMKDGQPWFVANDVANALGYSKPRNAVATHVDEDDALKQGVIDSLGRTQQMTFINESGFYSLVLASRLPNAKKFKRWVTAEILPTIRRTGGYVGNEDMFVESYLPFADDAVKNLFRLNLITIRQLNEKIRKDEPLVQFANQVADTENVIDIGRMARLAKAENIRIGRNRLFRFLKECGVFMTNNLPYQQYIERGYFVVKESLFEAHGVMKTYQQTYVTGRGDAPLRHPSGISGAGTVESYQQRLQVHSRRRRSNAAGGKERKNCTFICFRHRKRHFPGIDGDGI